MPNPEMWDGSFQKRPLPKKGSPLARGKPKPISQAQRIRTAFLQGIREERLRAQRTDKAVNWCEGCGTFTPAPELQLHHVTHRSQGQRYKPGHPGIDAPANVKLVCPDCHRSEHEQ